MSLYDQYSSRVYGLALKMLGDPMSAEEITQEAFLKVWTRADTFDPNRGSFPTWLLTITRRLAIDRMRLWNRRPKLAEPPNPDEGWRWLPDPASEGEEPRWRSVKLALQELPREQQEAIGYAFYGGLSHSQIAETTGIPLGTVKTRIRLGMEKLRRSLMEKKV